MKTKKHLMSLGTAIATSKLVKAISRMDADRMIGRVGLARRRSHFWDNAALLGLGALAGAGVALLLAPTSGKETRQRIGGEVDRLAGIANEKLRGLKEQAPSLAKSPSSENQYGYR